MQRLRRSAVPRVRLVNLSQDLGDRSVAQRPLAQRARQVRPVSPRADLDAVHRKRPADRGPQPLPGRIDERAGQRRSELPREILAAALRTSVVCSSSRLWRLSPRISCAASLFTPQSAPHPPRPAAPTKRSVRGHQPRGDPLITAYSDANQSRAPAPGGSPSPSPNCRTYVAGGVPFFSSRRKEVCTNPEMVQSPEAQPTRAAEAQTR